MSAITSDRASRQARRPRPGRRILRQRNLVLGGAMVALVIVVGIVAPWISPASPYSQNLAVALQPPSAAHLFGTDQYGRDVLSRIIFGARLSLIEIALGVGMSVVVGVPIGIIAGYYGGRIDQVITWFLDIIFAFPGLVLALLIVSILGANLFNMLIAIAVFSVPVYGRLARNVTLALKQVEYTEAARALGARAGRVMFSHILRNSLAPLIVQATLSAGTIVLTAASLSFLGLGAQPPTPEWGAMVSNGRNFLGVDTSLSLFPGLAILFAVLGFNILGDGLRDLLDPRFRGR